MSPTKRCTRCLEEKPLAAFYKNTGTTDGAESLCMPCKAEYNAEYERPAPKVPKTADELMESGNLTAKERMLVLRCVAELKRYHRAMRKRMRERARGKFAWSNVKVVQGDAEHLLWQERVPWKRQVRIMSCAIALAKEQGVEFSYTKQSAVAARIREQVRKESA